MSVTNLLFRDVLFIPIHLLKTIIIHNALTRVIQYVCSPDGSYQQHDVKKFIIKCYWIKYLQELLFRDQHFSLVDVG